MFTVTLPELGSACFLSSFTDSFRIPFFLQCFLLVRLSVIQAGFVQCKCYSAPAVTFFAGMARGIKHSSQEA